MDPYYDLHVLQQMPSLTQFRLLGYGRYHRRQELALAFTSSLCYSDVSCNEKHRAKHGFVYLRCPNKVFLYRTCLVLHYGAETFSSVFVECWCEPLLVLLAT